MVEFVYPQLLGFLSLQEDDIDKIGVSIPIPKFSSNSLIQLCTESISIFKKCGSVLHLESPICVIGDLHGNFIDLLRIFLHRKPPPETNYLFLGDFVDRGQFSIEVITLLICLKCVFPSKIHLLRGNHEFSNINSQFGFQAECDSLYQNSTLWAVFNCVFTWMPLAAIIDKKYFCVHGGISPNIEFVDMISSVPRPIENYEEQIVADLLWSDPSDNIRYFSKSPRGIGFKYGMSAVVAFLLDNGLKHIIRAHQSINSGVSTTLGGLVTTVYSSSGFGPKGEDAFCGIIEIVSPEEMNTYILKPMPEMLLRSIAAFRAVTKSTLSVKQSASMRTVNDVTLGLFSTITEQKQMSVTTSPKKCNNVAFEMVLPAITKNNKNKDKRIKPSMSNPSHLKIFAKCYLK